MHILREREREMRGCVIMCEGTVHLDAYLSCARECERSVHLQDIPRPSVISAAAHVSSNLWFGRGAATSDGGCAPVHTHLHSDPWDNLYVVVKGNKVLQPRCSCHTVLVVELDTLCVAALVTLFVSLSLSHCSCC